MSSVNPATFRASWNLVKLLPGTRLSPQRFFMKLMAFQSVTWKRMQMLGSFKGYINININSPINMENQLTENFYNSPIANPIANDTLRDKILKLVRHLNREKELRRGVKDVVKAIKKGSKGVVVLAADVSPVDVISHIPVLCEDNQIPYIFVRSRLQLGVAAETKKPTSVVLLLAPTKKELTEKFTKLHDKIKANHPFF